MKRFSRILAALLAAVLTLTLFAGCHGKDAVVATYSANGKTYDLSSGEYIFAMILADSEARNLVAEEMTDAEKNSSEEIDYAKKTVDGKKFYDWVDQRTEELCQEFFQISADFDKNKLKLSDSDKEGMDSYLSYQWQLSGYMYICEPNGVSYDSFKSFQEVFTYQRNTLFKYIYGEGGPKEVSKDDIAKSLTDNFTIANVLEIDSTKLAADSKKESLEKAKNDTKAKMEGYLTRLKAGESFKTIYDEYQAEQKKEEESTSSNATSSNATSSDATSSNTTSSNTASSNVTSSAATSSGSEEEEIKPLDELATLFGSEDSSAANDKFKDIMKCEIGTPTLNEKDGVFTLIIRKDIAADPYYPENYNDEALRLIKNEEFTADLEKKADKLEVEFNSYERGHLSPKKIDYSTYQQYLYSMYNNYGY